MSGDVAWLIAVVAGMLVGLVGIVIQVVPGLILIVASQLVWALVDGTWTGWVAFAIGLLIAVAAWVLMFYLPGKRLQAAGIPSYVLVIAALAGIVGFFVVPVVGLPLFFIGAVYAVESLRHRHAGRSLSSTWQAVKAAGLSLLIELTAGMLAVSQWVLWSLVGAVVSP